MLKTSLFAALALAAAGLAPGLASAQTMGERPACGPQGCIPNNYAYTNDGGLGRYCPPGYYPHAWPTDNGIRCEALDGRWVD
jgi:hypothetical protein